MRTCAINGNITVRTRAAGGGGDLPSMMALVVDGVPTGWSLWINSSFSIAE
ncbi:MAG TPA: hypothetical protein PLY66_06380 [Acidobacteriota bacterium]|nr:hypothetical protein [Acidobacteriota bacterium]HOT00615.1 hypothetical protein [Acidobacteriota bacterium]HQF87735.1 hypothetical protein [Acidobacteriota bacterium]HQG92451.1 hypothetical protein [Acidobacteriota bacterium]HQK87690.1 hypothetical protein [Acidobacteriota bacterium]